MIKKQSEETTKCKSAKLLLQQQRKKIAREKTSLNYIFARRLFRLVFGRFGWHFVQKKRKTNFVFFLSCTMANEYPTDILQSWRSQSN